ncbi:hypothetical protein AWZ03_010660 [Drosophila navojoa]|uniref:Uncharacterized protein n=1 Tax=Drosophila navojoa TaxID=7232 RepID=A0A484B2Q0_DRONA|nr:hypothetical protein AWZ03_010660 [Drosophila navojoa]
MQEVEMQMYSNNTEPDDIEKEINELSIVSINQMQSEAEVKYIDDKYWEIYMDVLTKKLCHLGCNVVQLFNPFRTLFSIDFSKGTFIVIEIRNSKISLEQISPEHPNFVNIKNHLDKTQDILGLIIFLATCHLC